MKLIIGLGNPGDTYEKTRHNAGFWAVDILAGTKQWNMQDKFQSETCETKIGKHKVLLAKPHTFMNNSGLAVS
ncbi:MAG: aminoacyl-tRNA hydrolase, partial [Patescibacteria group bacterium]|nr:aminoacyl-tRNA hydrolase [Patescibacteria group bacterium]